MLTNDLKYEKLVFASPGSPANILEQAIALDTHNRKAFRTSAKVKKDESKPSKDEDEEGGLILPEYRARNFQDLGNYKPPIALSKLH